MRVLKFAVVICVVVRCWSGNSALAEASAAASQEMLPVKVIPWNGVQAAEAESHSVTVYEIPRGYLLVDNRPGSFYSVEIPCHKCRIAGRNEQNMFMDVDGRRIQALALELKEFTDSEGSASPEAILTAHRNFELSLTGKLLQREPRSLASEGPRFDPKTQTLLWHMQFPPGGLSKARGRVYLTSKVKDKVLVLLGVVEGAADRQNTQQLLQSIRDTLQISNAPITPHLK